MGEVDVKQVDHNKGRETPDSAERRLTPSGSVLILTVTAASCAAILLWLPRPVEPVELPTLVLRPDAIERVLAQESRLARQHVDSEEARRMWRLFREQGRAETDGDTEEALVERGRRLQSAAQALRDAAGDEALRALRARATLALSDVLAGDDSAEESALLGSFPRVLARYGAAQQGRMVAPTFVIRTLYKARWNAIFKLEPTDGFVRVEEQAYWGWLALHASAADMSLRRDALQQYANAGGSGATEAAGVLAYQNGRADEAAEIFNRLHAQTGQLRYRNYAMAALAAMY